ncbi:MAG TPA: sulfite exporter TauE/SafE family protein, partial [Solirubrobacter sp.]|nr:sulfite exporter TauE/SafE family protein [Solirubrobacter sp.]
APPARTAASRAAPPGDTGVVTALAILLGLAIGIVVGAVGGGGAILALPVLVYVLGEPVGPASTASLVVVTLAAAIGAGSLARHGSVCRRLALTFAAPAAVGSLLGTLASREVSGRALVLAFVPVMFVAAALTWRRAGERDTGGECPHPPLVRVIVSGLLVGVLTGFFGVGGGFLIVPVLTLWLGTPFRRAVGTSLLIIGLTGLAALTSHLVAGARPDLAVTATLATATGVGALLGSLVAQRAPTAILGRGFAVLLTTIALALSIDVLFLGGPPT